MELHDLGGFRESKEHSKNLASILTAIQNCAIVLEKYPQYRPVQEFLGYIHQTYEKLHTSKDCYDKVLAFKGIVPQHTVQLNTGK